MLIRDGVKYEEWIPEKEVEEFQPIVKEHVQDIFGNKSKYIEARRLKSEAGIGSRPDGFVIIFGDSPQWHIVEVELSSHQLYDHIVNQVGRFINGIKNPVTQKNIIDAIYQEITGSKISKVEVEEAIGSGEIHKFLTDLISLPPILTIIIEKRTQELGEAIDLLKYSPIKIVEFQTFTREGVGLAMHAHLFEPMFQRTGSLGNQKIIITGERERSSFERAKGLKLYIKDGKHYNPKEALVALGATLNRMVGGFRATMPDGTILDYVGSTKNGKSKIARVHAYLLGHGFTFS